ARRSGHDLRGCVGREGAGPHRRGTGHGHGSSGHVQRSAAALARARYQETRWIPRRSVLPRRDRDAQARGGRQREPPAVRRDRQPYGKKPGEEVLIHAGDRGRISLYPFPWNGIIYDRFGWTVSPRKTP